jgi:hypothetical protein
MSLLGVKVGRWESQTVSSSIPAAISAPTLTVSKHTFRKHRDRLTAVAIVARKPG